MEVSRSPSGRRQSRETETESPKSIYTRYIKSCFSLQPDSAPYYKQLLEYIEPGVSNGSLSLQSPRYYELKKCISPSGVHSVFTEITAGSPCVFPQIIVLEGFPSPECISALGAHRMLRPELFIGHLDFASSTSSSKRFFELPSLPSDRKSIIHTRLITLGQTFMKEAKLTSHAQVRIEAYERCKAFEDQLFRGRQYGSTRFRKVHLHNSQFFSVEQMVSFSVTQNGTDPWCGTFLVDQGKSLAGRHNLPWSSYTGGGRRNPDLIPIIPYNSPPGEQGNVNSGAPGSNFSFESLHLYHPVNNSFAQETLDLELYRQDPFFILSKLFSLAARSWSQLLNYLDGDIQVCSRAGKDQFSPALEQLRFNASLLGRIESFLAEDKYVIEERGVSSWPKPSDSELEERILVIQSSLLKDYNFLIGRCAQLAAKCEAGSEILVSAAQLLEAQKGINQAKQVHDLTKLAFIFIPLSFVASIFGMNVSAFKDDPPIWIYFVIALPLTMLSWFGSALFDRGRDNPYRAAFMKLWFAKKT